MDRKETVDEDPLYVVGIGASAGGLEALEKFFEQVTTNSGMAYVIVQHLSPDFDSLMDQLLARRTTLPIEVIKNGVKVRANTIYVMPPKKEVIIVSGCLLLADRDESSAPAFPIDRFFRSLAQDFGSHSIAVVLSGTGSDGSRGISDIHTAGGLVVSQSSETSKFGGMPRSADATGVVNMALSATELPKAIYRFVRSGVISKSSKKSSNGGVKEPLERITERIDQHFGLDFSNYKPSTIHRRIERRLAMSELEDMSEYADLVCRDDAELQRLYSDLLIGVTHFFRDQEYFDQVEKIVVPVLVQGLEEKQELRCWVVACATGEEAYSIAILLTEYLERINDRRPVRIYASDVHEPSLEFASRGLFDGERLIGVSEERKRKFFVERNDEFQVSPEIRKMVVFTHHNVLRDPPFTKIQFVSCRNMLIYFRNPAQRKAISLMHFGLVLSGFLGLGKSESLCGLDDDFKVIDEPNRVYQKQREVRFNLDDEGERRPPRYQKSNPLKSQLLRTEQTLLPAYDELLSRYMPAGILVGSKRELLHNFGAGEFLQLNNGRASSDILDQVIPELRAPLGTAIRNALRESETVSLRSIPFQKEGVSKSVRLVAWRLEAELYPDHVMVQFELEDKASRSIPKEMGENHYISDEVHELERELQSTREDLQSTIEQLQTANEELQSAIEELTTSNEELQSTNEELHSVNEELYTVNSEYQRKIDELTDLNNDMDNLLSCTNIHTIFLDQQLHIRRFTPGIAERFSLLPHDIGRRFDSFSYQIVYETLIDEVEFVLRTGRPFEREVQDNNGLWFLLRIFPYVAGEVIEGAVVTLVEITKMKMAQSKIQEMSEIVAHSNDAIYRLDHDGTIRTWNMGASQLYGFPPDEIVGKNVRLLIPDHLLDELKGYLNRAFAGQSVDHVETERKRKDGSVVQVSLTVSPIRGHSGDIDGVSVIARDITKQKLAEEEIRSAVRQRDQFLATLSHELRNPLSAILNATSLLRESGLDAEAMAEARDVVDHQLTHIARLLDDLLEVARFTNGKLILRREVVDLAKIAESVLECVHFQIENSKQVLHYEPPKEPLLVDGDVGRLQQAQVNLLVNASKYSHPNGVIRFRIERIDDIAHITVEDEGSGISSDLMPAIFEPFVQAKQSIERTQGGMGLGLPLVRMIASSHGGGVVASSGGSDLGSTFTLTLPLTDKKTTVIPPAEIEAPIGKRLLLVEDNDGIRKLLARSMELKGFDVQTAENGSKGFAILVKSKPDIAVVDIGLPDINGYELARKVRKNRDLDGVTLIAVTGYGREEDRKAAAEAGFDLHLVKPINPTELLQGIASLTRTKVSSDKT